MSVTGRGQSRWVVEEQHQEKSEDRYPLTAHHASHHWPVANLDSAKHPMILPSTTFIVAYINDFFEFFQNHLCLTSDTSIAPVYTGLGSCRILQALQCLVLAFAL